LWKRDIYCGFETTEPCPIRAELLPPDEILYSVVTLAFLESFALTSPNYYLKHMIDLERLLELQGPPVHGSPKYSQLHKLILFASLNTRRHSILAREEWKVIP